MNELEIYIRKQAAATKKPGETIEDAIVRCEIEAMDLLQGESNLISDNCVHADEVGLSDAEEAVEWLEKNTQFNKQDLF